MHRPSDDEIEDVIKFAYDLSAGLAEADREFAKRMKIVEVLVVRGILAVEDDEKVCHASFILTGENTKRLVLPKRERRLSLEDKNTNLPRRPMQILRERSSVIRSA